MDANILDLFIKNFIPKDRRERSEIELKAPQRRGKFTDKLNHKWDTILDMRFIFKIPSGAIDYEFAKSELKIKDEELCYIISNYDDIDGLIIKFIVAFDNAYGRGFGTLILTCAGDKLYLETEFVQGKQNRFIGKR